MTVYVTDVPVIDRMTDPTLYLLDEYAREEHNAALRAHIRATRTAPRSLRRY